MKTYELTINKSQKELFNLLFEPESYKIWSQAFNENSYYEGELKQGNTIYFGDTSGHCLSCEVLKYNENEIIVFGKFVDLVYTDNSIFKDDDIESYEFIKVSDDVTKLIITTLEFDDEMFNNMWENAIKNIKQLTK